MFQIFTITTPIFFSGLLLIFVLKKNLFNSFDYPLDGFKKIRGKRIFGKSKTIKGFLIHLIGCTLITFTFHNLLLTFPNTFIHQLFSENPIVLGFIYSVGFTLGELMNSFVKRQLNVPPGKGVNNQIYSFQNVIDLADGIIGIILLLLLFVKVDFSDVILAGLMGILLHYLTDLLMQKLELKKKLQ